MKLEGLDGACAGSHIEALPQPGTCAMQSDLDILGTKVEALSLGLSDQQKADLVEFLKSLPQT